MDVPPTTATPSAPSPPAPGRGRRPRRPGALAAAALLLLAVPTAVGGQEPSPGSAGAPERAADRPGTSRLLVEAGAGLFAPLADLAPTGDAGGGVAAEPAPSLSVAASASLGAVYLLGPSLGVGLHGTWSGPEVDLQRIAGGTASDGSARRLGSADWVAASAELVYRPLGASPNSSLDPYVAAGVGLRHLAFSDPGLADSTDPLGTVAGGVRTGLGGRFFWTLEARAFFSSTDPTSRGSRFQNDVLVTVGLGARL